MEIQNIDRDLITSIKDALRGLRPTKANAVKWLSLRSVVKSEAGEKFTKACVEHLLECKDCEEFEIDNLRLKKVTPQRKVYYSTPEVKEAQAVVDSLQAKLDSAKAELQSALDRAGFEEEDGNPYYKTM